MTELILKGKIRTILISISILLISAHTIYSFQSALPALDSGKLTQQGIRFLLTLVLLLLVYRGAIWARIVTIIFLGIAIIGSLYAIFTLQGSIVFRIPSIVMVTVYSIAFYHFTFSAPFKAFFTFQNQR